MNKEGEIIIIEDNEDDRNVLEYVFEKLGYPNRRAYFGDGASVLAYLEAPYAEPFLILSDVDLPYMDGIDLNSQLSTDIEISRTGYPLPLSNEPGNSQADHRRVQQAGTRLHH